MYLCNPKTGNAGVVELVDTLDLGSSASRRESSSLSARTKASRYSWSFFYLFISLINYYTNTIYVILNLIQHLSVLNTSLVIIFLLLIFTDPEFNSG